MATIVRISGVSGKNITRTLLYDNPNPTQNLGEVTLSVDIYQYEYILFEYKPIKIDNYEKTTIVKVVLNQSSYPIGFEENFYKRNLTNGPSNWKVSKATIPNGNEASDRIIITKIYGLNGEI